MKNFKMKIKKLTKQNNFKKDIDYKTKLDYVSNWKPFSSAICSGCLYTCKEDIGLWQKRPFSKRNPHHWIISFCNIVIQLFSSFTLFYNSWQAQLGTNLTKPEYSQSRMGYKQWPVWLLLHLPKHKISWNL